MAFAGGGSKMSASTDGGSTTVSAIAEGGIRPRLSIQARMRGDGASSIILSERDKNQFVKHVKENRKNYA